MVLFYCMSYIDGMQRVRLKEKVRERNREHYLSSAFYWKQTRYQNLIIIYGPLVSLFPLTVSWHMNIAPWPHGYAPRRMVHWNLGIA